MSIEEQFLLKIKKAVSDDKTLLSLAKLVMNKPAFLHVLKQELEQCRLTESQPIITPIIRECLKLLATPEGKDWLRKNLDEFLDYLGTL